MNQQQQLPLEQPPQESPALRAAASRNLALTANPARGNILARGTGFVSAYDFTLNPYSGCEFGCSYCYAVNFTADEDHRATWGNWTNAKTNAAQLLRRHLYDRRKADPTALDGKSIFMSTATDPYQPVEKQQRVTRELLEVLAGEQTPGWASKPRPKLLVQTRSPLAVRDADLFHRILDNGGRVQINMTVTTDSDELRRRFEPKCMSNRARMEAICQLHQDGIPTCITLTPLLGVENPDRFIQNLLDTGAPRFIIQEFHRSDAELFAAKTREEALNVRADVYGKAGRDYAREYREFRETLRTALAREGRILMGEEKNGFRPPW